MVDVELRGVEVERGRAVGAAERGVAVRIERQAILTRTRACLLDQRLGLFQLARVLCRVVRRNTLDRT